MITAYKTTVSPKDSANESNLASIVDVKANTESTVGKLASIDNKVVMCNTESIRTEMYNDLLNGELYEFCQRFEGVPSGDYVEVVFRIPSTTTGHAKIFLLEVAGSGAAWIDIGVSVIINTSGTSIPIFNKNLGSSATPYALAEYGGGYTVGEIISTDVLPGGSGVRAIGGLSEGAPVGIMGPDSSLYIRVTNKSQSAEDFSVRLVWSEAELSGAV